MTLNVTLFNSQLSRLNSGMKKVVNLKSSSDVFGDSNSETNFSHKLFLHIHTFRDFIKLLQRIHQRKKNYQKLNCIK